MKPNAERLEEAGQVRATRRLVIGGLLVVVVTGLMGAALYQPKEQPDVWATAQVVAKKSLVGENAEVAPAKYLSICSRVWLDYDTHVNEAATTLANHFRTFAFPSVDAKRAAIALTYHFSLHLEERAREQVLLAALRSGDPESNQFLLSLIKADLYRAILFARCEYNYGLTPTPPRGDIQERLREIYDQKLVGVSSAQFPSLVRVWMKGQPLEQVRRQQAYEWLVQFAQLAPFESDLRGMLTGEPSSSATEHQYQGLLRELSADPGGQSAFNTANEVYNETKNQKAFGEVNKRVDDLVSRVSSLEVGRSRLEAELQAMKTRVGALERWRDYVENEVILNGKLTFGPRPTELGVAQQHALLQRLAPVFVTANKEDFPVISPADFARNSMVVQIAKLPFDMPGDIAPAPRFESADTVGTLLEFAKNGNDTSFLALRLHASFVGEGWFKRDGKRNADFNRQSMAAGKGVLGAVRAMGERKLLVQYFLLLTHNTTADAPYGNHCGDWICVDLIVEASDLQHPKIVHALFHNHGRQFRIEPEVLQLRDGHCVVFLEEGVSEPNPTRGTRGFSGYPRSGLTVNKMFPDGEDYGSEHKVVRHHRGEGFEYHTSGAVIDVLNDQGEDARLVRAFKGLWGAHWKNFDPDDDVFPGLGFFVGGYQTESPRSPLYQDKMWNRNFEQSWLYPPWTGDGVPENHDWADPEVIRADARQIVP